MRLLIGFVFALLGVSILDIRLGVIETIGVVLLMLSGAALISIR